MGIKDTTFVPYGMVEYTRGLIGGVYIRPLDFSYPHKGHRHYIDHAHCLYCGDIVIHWEENGETGSVIIEGPKRLGDEPMWIPIAAGVSHWIESAGENIVAKGCCVFSQAEAEKVDTPKWPNFYSEQL